MRIKKFDVIVLGGGPGGYVAAIKGAQKGLNVALIEKEELGGVCLNRGCIPTKTLLKSAKIYQNALDSKSYGVEIKGEISPNWQEMIKRKQRVVRRLVGGVNSLVKANKVTLFKGYGEMSDKNTVKINDETINAKNIIIATGSSPFIPEVKGLDKQIESGFVITSKEMLDLKELPDEMIIIGGGVIALEFACLVANLGRKVTVLQRSKRVLRSFDEDLVDVLVKSLEKKGVQFNYGTTLKEFKNGSVVADINGEEKEFKTKKILMSLGVKANTEAVEKLGLKTEKGFIKTDDSLNTNIKGVYAIGDVNGRYQLAHVASHEGIVAIENILGENTKLHYDKITSCIYTFPEIAVVGISEIEAKERNLDVQVKKFSLIANGKALADGDNTGFIKMISDKEYGEVIGVEIVSSNATDLISEGTLALNLESTYYDIANTIHPHPSVSEIFNEVANLSIDKAIHAL